MKVKGNRGQRGQLLVLLQRRRGRWEKREVFAIRKAAEHGAIIDQIGRI